MDGLRAEHIASGGERPPVQYRRPRVSGAFSYTSVAALTLALPPMQLSDERPSAVSGPVHHPIPVLTDDELSSDSDSDTEPDMPAGMCKDAASYSDHTH